MTLFERVNRFIEKTNREQVSKQEMMLIGKLVASAYLEMKHPEEPEKYRYQEENGRKLKVRNYPMWFVRVMDAILRKHLEKPAPPIEEPKPIAPPIEKRVRKRIPAKPIFTTKTTA